MGQTQSQQPFSDIPEPPKDFVTNEKFKEIFGREPELGEDIVVMFKGYKVMNEIFELVRSDYQATKEEKDIMLKCAELINKQDPSVGFGLMLVMSKIGKKE